MPPEHFSVSGVEGNHLSVIWAGWGDRRLEKTANRHGENFLFAFLNEKKKVFEMLFISSQSLEDIFFSFSTVSFLIDVVIHSPGE